MVTNVLIIFTFICIIATGRLSYASETLNSALDGLTEFFEKLSTKYEYQSLNQDILHKIDNEVISYNKNAINRQKRQLHSSLEDTTAINILEGFDEISTFNVQGFQHATFFSFLFNENLFWFMASIGSEGLSLYRYNNGTFDHIESYPEYNGKRIIVDNFKYNTVAIIQNLNESIVILKFNYNYTTYQTTLSFVQTLEVSTVTDIHTWHYMNHLYLGIASHYNISIYAWLGEHFDVMQVLNFGAEKLMFFQNKGFMNLICITSRTVMLRYFFQFNKFVIVQTLPASNAIMTFDIKKNHLEEHFICLSMYKRTIVYKEVHGHFVPFQEILATEKIIPIVVDKAVVLLSVNKNVTTTYQYDGWKFVQLSTKLSYANDVYLIKVDKEELIIIRHRVTTWKLVKPRWGKKKSLHSLQNDIMSWCLEAKTIAQRVPKFAQILETPLYISNSHIHEISTQNINGHSTKKLEKLTKQYKYLVTQFKAMNHSLSQKIYNTNSRFKTIHAKKVQVTCESSCKVNNMVIEEKDNPLFKLRSVRNINQNSTFASLKTKGVNNFKCPTPSFTPQSFYPKKLINNMSLSDLQENTLKISGNQVVTGDHVFVELDTVHSIIPLDIATNFTTQTIHAKEIRVKELKLKKGGFLLPLSGPPSRISGHLTASKVTVKGYIDIKGALGGEGSKSLMPVKQVLGFMEIYGDRNFNNVKIANILNTKDIYRQKGKSLKQILDNAVSLHTNNQSKHFIFSSNNVEWKNVAIRNYYNKWITAHSNNKVIITGKKQTTHNVTLVYSPHTVSTIPKLNFPLCGSTANISSVHLSHMPMGNMTVQNLNSFHIFGAEKLNSTIFETITSIDTIDFSKKYFIGSTDVKNILPFDIKGFNVKGFQEIINVWREANIFKDVKNAIHLKANTLQAPTRFELPLPTTVRNVISKGNTYVGTINGVNFNDFMRNVIKIDDINSLYNITFSTGFISNHLQFLHGPLNLTYSGTHPHFHSKHISGQLKTERLNVLKPIIHNIYDATTNFIVQGNVTFRSEPTLHNVNDFNLNQLSSEIYKIDEDIVISGKNFEIKNMTVTRNNISQISLRVPYYDTWSNMSRNLLSKTKPQEIIVPCCLNDVEIDNIKGSKNLSVITSDPDVKNMIEMSLKKNNSQVISSKWHFEELILPGYVNLRGKINNLDLKSDVVKHNTKQNIITGKKTILELATKQLFGLNFSEWSQNAVVLSGQELIVIKGQKVFTDINIQDLSLTGTIMGKKIENALLKSKSQIITGSKIFNGNITIPSILLDGLVNDVNFTSFTKYLLKKNKPMQRFITNITLEDNLEVQGNIFIEDLYNGIKINNLSTEYKRIESVGRDLEQVANVVKGGETALNNRAFYVNKLKIYKNITTTSNLNNSNSLNNINSQCELKNLSLFCDNIEMQGFSLESDIANYTTIQVVKIKESMVIVSITADCVSIYVGRIVNTRFYRKKVFCVPNILRASVESLENSLWIILQLPTKMLALHYVQWDDMELYILPPSDILITSTPPDRELLMFRSDGVWSLGELGSPHHIVKEPLTEKIETFSYGKEYYIKNIKNNSIIFMRPIYVGKDITKIN